MFQNYLKIALRSLLRQKLYSAINIIGLAVGVAACLAILLYVKDELSFDTHHVKSERIIRAIYEPRYGGKSERILSTPSALAPVMRRSVPEVENAVRIYSYGAFLVSNGVKTFEEKQACYGDSTLFEVFTLPMLAGNPRTALGRPQTVVITRSMAMKYFGTIEVLGKSLRLGSTKWYEITGVIEDIPRTSHLQYSIFASFTSVTHYATQEMWDSANFLTYILLRPQASIDAVQKKIPDIIKRNISADYGEASLSVSFEPLKSIYLESEFVTPGQPKGSIYQVYGLIMLAVLLLLSACVNYTNLATARSQKRAREVGVRKTVGARGVDISVQFFAETTLLALVALVLGLLLLELVLPIFSTIIAKPLSISLLSTPVLVGFCTVIWGAITLLAGSYPAFYMASVRPDAMLKNGVRLQGSAKTARKILVVGQFAVSIVLVSGTLILREQLSFVQTKDLGLNAAQVLVFSIDDRLTAERLSALKSEIMRSPGVINSSPVEQPPTSMSNGYAVMNDGIPSNQRPVVTAIRTDRDILQTLGIKLLVGTSLPNVAAGDSTSYFVLNKAMAATLGWKPEEAVGKPFNLSNRVGRVVGVMQDFHHESLHSAITPMIFYHSLNDQPSYMLVKIAPENIQTTLAALSDVWRKVIPHRAFEYSFLDKDFEALYTSEQVLAKVVSIFAILAIGIGCLGLFALTAFTAEQRTKEIGIRKVLGASVASIIALLSKDFLKLVGVAILLATPLAYWAAGKWLQDFAYRVDLSWWVFASAGLAAVVIAFMTVAGQAWRAAQANPATSLRSE